MEKFFDTKAAANYLHEQICGESLKYWSVRLNNLRRTDRLQPFSLQFTKIEGKAGFYSEHDLAAYAEFEKTRRIGKLKLSGRASEALRAFGIGEQGGGAQGRRFKGGSAALAVANDGTGVFVQVVINEPLLVYAMTPDQAIELGRDLVEFGHAAKRQNLSQSLSSDGAFMQVTKGPAANTSANEQIEL